MTCTSTWIDPRNKVVINGVEHAGLTTHKCSLPKDHPETNAEGNVICQCECGHRWVRNIK